MKTSLRRPFRISFKILLLLLCLGLATMFLGVGLLPLVGPLPPTIGVFTPVWFWTAFIVPLLVYVVLWLAEWPPPGRLVRVQLLSNWLALVGLYWLESGKGLANVQRRYYGFSDDFNKPAYYPDYLVVMKLMYGLVMVGALLFLLSVVLALFGKRNRILPA